MTKQVDKKPEAMLGYNGKYDLTTDVRYPILGSYKYDGFRITTFNHMPLTRTLKEIPNLEIQEMLSPLCELKSPIDLEIYIHEISFNELSSFLMSTSIKSREHHNKIKRLIKNGELKRPFNFYIKWPDNLTFNVFDIAVKGVTAIKRYEAYMKNIPPLGIPRVNVVEKRLLNNAEEVEAMFKEALDLGLEGLVLNTPQGEYKYGRSTLRENLFLKLKPYETYKGIIMGVNPVMKNLNDSFRDERGYKKKSNTILDKLETDVAASLDVMWKGNPLKVTLTGTVEERTAIYANANMYIGRTVYFTGLGYGMKTVPRHCKVLEIKYYD